jgi:hypothetical protein
MSLFNLMVALLLFLSFFALPDGAMAQTSSKKGKKAATEYMKASKKVSQQKAKKSKKKRNVASASSKKEKSKKTKIKSQEKPTSPPELESKWK